MSDQMTCSEFTRFIVDAHILGVMESGVFFAEKNKILCRVEPVGVARGGGDFYRFTMPSLVVSCETVPQAEGSRVTLRGRWNMILLRFHAHSLTVSMVDRL